MTDRSDRGTIFGIPYNFERPSIRRLFATYWQPGERMVVEKPFGIGYTLNLANWRSWVVLGVAAAMVWHERTGGFGREDGTDTDEEPVEVIIEDD